MENEGKKEVNVNWKRELVEQANSPTNTNVCQYLLYPRVCESVCTVRGFRLLELTCRYVCGCTDLDNATLTSESPPQNCLETLQCDTLSHLYSDIK